ncbi:MULTISPECIES: thioredoxin family protein [Cyanophyceae]|uniref:Thioredoxin family protein n=1 Tax=Leptolyngbya subtilissima DQ-A4 TaxID=2933933 RepID=A0ABV0K1N9_9CYAN|nr:thioredoxin family protein [Nodosilinea sp. FACHB-141]MBD2111401.1 thioredoxin family protein [Nodosilinea sp. FACHB-141]
MAMVESTMLPLGTAAPHFELRDVVSGQTINLGTFADAPALLVMFICRHCPFVKHVEQELGRLGRDYGPKGVGIVAISANSLQTHPQDGPEHLKAQAQAVGFTFPYCFDETQEIAKAYTAACTPDFFLFDEAKTLAYRGQLDDSRPGNNLPVTGEDLRTALDAVLAAEAMPGHQKPSIGCNIKWTPGNEPDYFG